MKADAQTMSFYDLRDALAQPGCAVCRLKADSADRFLDGLLYESVNDPRVRHEVSQARGFCHLHAWGLVRAGRSLGVAILLRDVLRRTCADLERATFRAPALLSVRRVQEALDARQPSAATAELVARLEPQAPCPACVWAEKMEDIYVEGLLKHLLGEGGLLAAYESSDGLCLPHLRQALAQVRDERAFEALVAAQRAIWERLVGDLSEFIRKNDHRFHDEPWGEERDAWLRAVAALAGARPDLDAVK